MAGTGDIVLVGLIGLCVIGFLVLVIIYGSSYNNQITTLSQNLQAAFLAAEVEFTNLVSDAVQVFSSLADTAGHAFATLMPQIVDGFNNIATFFTDQLTAIIKSVQNNLFATSSTLGGFVQQGITSISSAFGTTISQIQQFFYNIQNAVMKLVDQATMFVMTFVNQIINIVVNGVSGAIVTVIQGIETVVQTIGDLFVTGLDSVPALISDAQSYFNSLISSAESRASELLSAIVAFGDSIVAKFSGVPWDLACSLRCVCHYIPLAPCPNACCSGNCSCTTSCFFPANCCASSGCSGTLCGAC